MKQKQLKSKVKYLAVAPNTRIARSVLQALDDSVVRAIANAAINAAENPGGHLTPANREFFKRHAKSFEVLTSRQRSLSEKRKHILAPEQKVGALPLVVPILASVLGSLGFTHL